MKFENIVAYKTRIEADFWVHVRELRKLLCLTGAHERELAICEGLCFWCEMPPARIIVLQEEVPFLPLTPAP